MEASDTLLGIPLFGTDPDTTIKWLGVSINRNRRLKSKKDIEQLDTESTEIFYASLIDIHYPNRPIELEKLSLFEYARNYDIVKLKPTKELVKYWIYPGYGYVKQRSRPYLIKHPNYNPNTEPEKYFHCLLMLFKSWRQETDILENHMTYVDAFIACRETVEGVLNYHERLRYLRKSKEDLNILLQELLKPKVLPENYNDFQQTEVQVAMNELNLNSEYHEDVNNLINNLNSDQLRVFNFIKESLSSKNKQPIRHFVSGVGGTGKSFLIKTIKTYINTVVKKNVAITAPTGISAYNIKGMTIHRLLQLPVEHGNTPSYRPLSNNVLKIIRHTMENVVLLIIDEISMVSNITLSYIHLRLCEIFDTSDSDNGWFGRINILVLGDLLQLPPVNEASPFITLNSTQSKKYLNSLGTVNLWATLFTYDELTQNMRQKNDPTYANILGRVRVNAVTLTDIDKIMLRKIAFKSNTKKDMITQLNDLFITLPRNTIALLPK